MTDEKTKLPNYHEVQIKQAALAEKSGLAIVLVDEKSVVSASQNNSICEVFQTASSTFSAACEQFCGRAFAQVNSTNEEVSYRCHAGLNCVAMPFEALTTIAIVGRAFLTSADYRSFTERVRIGDLQKIEAAGWEDNLLFANSLSELEGLATKVLALKREILPAENLSQEIAAPNSLKPVANPNELLPFIETENDKILTDSDAKVLTETQADLTLEEEFDLFADFVTDSAPLQDAPNRTPEKREVTINPPDNTETKIPVETPEISAQTEEIRMPNPPLSGNLASMIQVWRDKQEADNKSPMLSELPMVIMRKQGVSNQIEMSTTVSELKNDAVPTAAKPVIPKNSEINKAKEESHAGIAQTAETPLATISSETSPNILPEKLNEEPKLPTANVSAHWQDLKSLDFQQNFKETCLSAMRLLAEKFSISGLAWLDRRENRLATTFVFGDFKTPQMQIGLDVTDSRLLKVIAQETSLSLQAKNAKNENAEAQLIELFPLAIGNEIRCALVIGEKLKDTATRREVAQFCRRTAADLELLILREELKQRDAAATDLQKKAEKFETMAITDKLTGWLNRHYLDERLGEEINRSERHGYPMSFMMIDVDNFGKFNKDFGHQIGDEVLRVTAKMMKLTLRLSDVAVRYGGEEFCILLPQTTLPEARAIAERIRQRVEKTEFPQRQITISIGVAAYSQKLQTPQSIIKAADDALHLAKNNGKNNVQIVN